MRRGRTRKERRKTRRRIRRRVFRGGSVEAKTVVVIETRKHKAMPFVLRNALTELDPSWSVLVFYGTENEEWLRGLLAGELKDLASRIRLEPLGQAYIHTSTLNALMRDRSFIEKIPTEIFLILQMDSMICSGRGKEMDRFTRYDYVGAPWRNPFGDAYAVGNGGASLRRKSKVLEVLDKCHEKEDKSMNEDIFYSRKCANDILKKPSIEEAAGFSVETKMHPAPIMVHSPWKHFSEKDLGPLRQACGGLDTLKGLQ